MSKELMNKSDYYFDLPQSQIAQTPVLPRDSCRMLCVEKNNPFNYQDKIFNMCKSKVKINSHNKI